MSAISDEVFRNTDFVKYLPNYVCRNDYLKKIFKFVINQHFQFFFSFDNLHMSQPPREHIINGHARIQYGRIK